MPDITDIEEPDPDAPPPIYQTIGLADGDDPELDSDVTAQLEAARQRICKKCDKPIEQTGSKGRPLSYHPDCRPGATHSGMTGSDQAGTTINVNSTDTTSRKGKAAALKAEQLEKVEQNTKALFEHFVAPMLNMAAQANNNPLLAADAIDVHTGAPAIAKATRNLAEHEDWLRKMLAGGEASARAMAWVGFAFTVGPIVVPILVRHKVIPEQLAGGVPGVAAQPVAA